MSQRSRLGDSSTDRTRSGQDPTSATRGHIPSLDGVRGFAILLVLAAHFASFRPVSPVDRSFVKIVESGWIGVDLFFVLSGFLITGILLDDRGAPSAARTFYLRRFLRIFPLYYGMLAVIVLTDSGGWFAQPLVQHQAWFWTYLTNVLQATGTFIHGWSHFWSLAVEEQFYVIWPAVVLTLSLRRVLTVCVVCMLLAPMLRVLLWLGDASPVLSYVSLATRMDSLAIGAALAVLFRTPDGRIAIARHTKTVLSGAAVVLGIVLVRKGGLPLSDSIVNTIGFSALAVASGSLIALCISDESSLPGRLFGQSWLRFFGTYSYGMYVLHRLVFHMLHRWGLEINTLPIWGDSRIPAALLMYVAGVGATTAVAIVSWHMYEKQFLKLKRYVPYHRTTATVRGKLATT